MTKQVQLADDAYHALRRSKRPGESFSDTVRRITRPRGSLADLVRHPLPPDVMRDRDRILAEADRLDRPVAPRE